MKYPLWLWLPFLCWPGALPVPAAEDGRPLTHVSERVGSEDPALEIAQLLAELDADAFATREAASERLHRMAADPAFETLLARTVQQALVDPGISFEVRKQLEQLRRILSPADLPPGEEASSDQIESLIDQLADDSYARRLGAQNRLRWLLGDPRAVEPIYAHLKRRLVAADAPLGAAQASSGIAEEARAAWLESDPADCNLPAVSDEEITRWIEELAEPAVPRFFLPTRQPLAAVELRDLLARSGYVEKARIALEERRAAGSLTAEAEGRLDELIDLTRPAMVAEFWDGGRNLNIQHLLVGVPSVSEGGTSHFDRIDDRTAHCVSGVNLTEGDYPVGVALPHPTMPSALFHLINLPTPRRRMAYEYQSRRDETQRFDELVQRTLDHYRAQRRPLQESEMSMILRFPPEDVSQFASQYLARVEDQALPAALPFGKAPAGIERLRPIEAIPAGPPERLNLGGPERVRPSLHGLLCAWLAARGTNAAIPGLLEAIDGERVMVPSGATPYRFDRFAALAIARRDPWPEVDTWLARMIPRRETLIAGQPDGPQLGATAAAILLSRHSRLPEGFELVARPDDFTRQYGLVGYSYLGEDSHLLVERWWSAQSESGTEPPRTAASPEERQETSP